MKNIIKNYKLETIFYCFIIFWIVSVLITNCSNETQIKSNSQPPIQSEVVDPIEPEKEIIVDGISRQDYFSNLNTQKIIVGFNTVQNSPRYTDKYFDVEILEENGSIKTLTTIINIKDFINYNDTEFLVAAIDIILVPRALQGISNIDNMDSTYSNILSDFLTTVSQDPLTEHSETFSIKDMKLNFNYSPLESTVTIKHILNKD